MTIKELLRKTDGALISSITCAEVGCMTLIDELYREYPETLATLRHMHTDQSLYVELGGYIGFMRANNKRVITDYVDMLASNGYIVHSIDFIDDDNGVLFLNVDKVIEN